MIPLPEGFIAAGISSGISNAKKPDLAIFYSTKPCNAAAVFTTNQVKAASVIVSEQKIRSGKAQAIVANSGCANACTGKQGLSDAKKMCADTAKALGIEENQVLVASTGVIGKFLPMKKIQNGIKKLAAMIQSPNLQISKSLISAVSAILTTDTVPKISVKQLSFNGKRYTIWGCAKGAGMIHPKLATMLAFIFTDAWLSSATMKKMLKEAVERSFNCLSVDGDTSTNDTVFFLSNGTSGVTLKKREELQIFQNTLTEVCSSLAEQIASDGEGATKRIDIFVNGARSDADAKKIAETVATSPLVKTAIFGKDPNWGRIMAAIGRAQAKVEPEKIEIALNHLTIAKKGAAVPVSMQKAREALNRKTVPICIELNLGKGSARYTTCDFSYDYVKINADYTT